ncbi:MAG: CoA transferase, partial [Chloroflexi bacterium]|nr:CoA transferase [Chloroflexota bacterium]
PFCTMLLADMGADVVKVEKPGGGDDTRRMGPPFVNGESAAFLGINRNKRSIVVDIKAKEGVELVQRMASESDVFVQNFRPGSLERMGLGYEQLKEINPALVYCTISGFGTTGPYARRAGFDLVAQGMSGLMSINGHPGGPPTKIGVPITDLNAGIFAAFGILTAYIHRLKTGQGQHVDTSLMESGIACTVWESATYFATGQIPGPMGSAHRLTAPYQAFQTSDGYVNIGAANQSNWERLCRAIGREELVEDSRFLQPSDRMDNIDALTATLDETFASESSQRWLDTLAEAGVPAGPIYNMAEVYADPQVQAREMMVEMDHPTAGRIKNIGVPVKLSETPGSVRSPSPLLGQHTDEVLSEMGCSEAEIARLRSAEVVR